MNKAKRLEKIIKIWATAILLVGTPGGLAITLFQMRPQREDVLFLVVVYLALFLVSFMIHIVAHEGGHLLGGLASGYRFASFRILNVMLVKKHGVYCLKRFHIVGTGGQCLMIPPQPFRPDYPYRLYNLAGGLVNFFLAGICLIFRLELLPVRGTEAWPLLFLIPMIVLGAYFGITSLIPMKIGGIANDGCNLLYLAKSPEARRSLWVLLDGMAYLNQDGRLKELPEAWFFATVSPEETKKTEDKDPFHWGLAMHRFAYLMDCLRLQEAATLAEEMMASKDQMPQVYQYEMQCEILFLTLLGFSADLPEDEGGTDAETRQSLMKKTLTPELKKYIHATRSYPMRQRLAYAMAKLADEEESAAAGILLKFEKACKTYPNQGEISNEREFIALIDKKATEAHFC